MALESLFSELEPHEDDQGGGHYRCRDNINNFRFHIKVRPVTSSLPSLLSLSTDSLPATPDNDAAVEEVTLSWQKKIFSEAEFRKYANAKEEDFESPMKKKLVGDAKKMAADGFVPKNKIFTRVEGEADEEDNEAEENVTTNPEEEPSFLSLMMREGMRRRGAAMRPVSSAPASIPTRNIVTHEPTRELQLKNHIISTPIQTMVS